MTHKTQRLLQAYAIAGIKRSELKAAQRRLVDRMIMMLIHKSNQEDQPIESIGDALREIPDIIRDDPLFL